MEKKIKSAHQLKAHFGEMGSHVPHAIREDLSQFEFGQLPDITILTNFFISEINYAIKLRQAEERIYFGLQKICQTLNSTEKTEEIIRNFFHRIIAELFVVGLHTEDVASICVEGILNEAASPFYLNGSNTQRLLELEKIVVEIPNLILQLQPGDH